MTEREGKRRVVVWVDTELHRAVKIKAVMTETTISSVIRDALDEWLAEDGDEPKDEKP